MKEILIAPSIISCDLLFLEREIRLVEEAGANLIHIDVMDGRFVPNITFGPLVVKAVRRATSLPLDVHLMIESPERYIEEFAKAGADIITIHIEAELHPLRTLDIIKKYGKRAGISLNPSTPLSLAEFLLEEVDLLLIMTVNPGFAGQRYIASMERKIKEAKTLIERLKKNILLEVDGGINVENARNVVEAGADILVMGTEIFESKDYKGKIEQIRNSLYGKGL